MSKTPTYKVMIDLYQSLSPLPDGEIEENISSFLTRVRNGQLPLELTISQELVVLLFLKALAKEDTEVRRAVSLSLRTEEGHVIDMTKEGLKDRLPGLVKKALE